MQLLKILIEPAIECCCLMGVLSITQVLDFRCLNMDVSRGWTGFSTFRSQFIKFARQVIGNRRIIGGSPSIHLGSQRTSQLKCGATFLADLISNLLIICRINNNGDALMILGGTAQHGRTTNINIFNGLLKADVRLGNRGFEWIKVDHHEINGVDTVFLDRFAVGCVFTEV